jgi:hypothetical protein
MGVLADTDLIDVEDDEGDPPVAFIDDGSVEATSSEEVTATKTAFNDFDTLLDNVAEATGELGWDGFVEQDENDTEDDEEEEDGELLRPFQLHEMEKIPRGTTGDDMRGDLPRDRLFGFRGFKKPLRNLVNGVAWPSMTNIGRLGEE